MPTAASYKRSQRDPGLGPAGRVARKLLCDADSEGMTITRACPKAHTIAPKPTSPCQAALICHPEFLPPRASPRGNETAENNCYFSFSRVSKG